MFRRNQPLCGLMLLFFGITLLYYTAYLNPQLTRVTANRKSIASPEVLFLYRAYLLNSKRGVTIRVLSINQCVNPKWRLMGYVGGRAMKFRAKTIENRCPWLWAPGCKYNSYVLDANLLNDTVSETVTLFLRGRNVSLPLHRLPLRKSGTLSVCVPPIYWFTDWIKIIFFLETWKEQGASHVYMYYHSSSRSVLQVLRHYEEQGFVTMVPWPSLPRSQVEDPNKSVYRLAHSLAHNDCVLRIESEFGALVDIDEIIVPRSGTLLPFIVEKFSNATIGAFAFPHRSLMLSPALAGDKFSFVDLDFSGILNATESQVIFRAAAVSLQSTHFVRMFRDRSIVSRVSPSEAVLLHYRYTNRDNGSAQPVDLFPNEPNADAMRATMLATARRIFPNGAEFHYATQKELGRCLKRWRKTQNQCKTPVTGCWNVVASLEDWHFTEDGEQFHIL
ncbi:hypothetical protein Q1695_002294 [Nippostrongylus brasiliensis]|nr:hypothetical protein Q1695_002294 [Nippostrongylus brasiliensis]